MNLKLLACLACSAAFLLGACSSNNSTGTSSGSGGTGNGGTDETGGDGNGSMMESDEMKAAREAVGRALAAAETARTGSEQDRTNANNRYDAAIRALQDAVNAALKAVTDAEGGTALAVGNAARARDNAINFQRAQTILLNNALASFSWFRRVNARNEISRTRVVVPGAGTNTVTIMRTLRTRPASTADDAPEEVNPNAFKSDTFKPVMYADGKVLLAGSGRTASGSVTSDEFKVDGDVVSMDPRRPLDTNTYTGLTLTTEGLSIRVGGTRSSGSDAEMTDYTDMRRDITRNVDDADDDGGSNTPRGQNGWDLTIAFNEPRPTPTADDRYTTSWQGNGDFYWRGIVPADRTDQLTLGGDYYESDAFNQPTSPVDQRDLGIYEVWLSNHYDLDRKAEPENFPTTTHPSDDVNRYLNYAAYGLFVYTASPATFRDGENGHENRVQSMSFGYQAFANEDGKRTKDIGTAITTGKFKGQTLATVLEGRQDLGTQSTTLLRGKVSLTVTIPKGSDTPGRLLGTLSNFEEWTGTYWQTYQPNTDPNNGGAFSVRLDNGTVNRTIAIGPNGSYSGTATSINAGHPTTGVNQDDPVIGAFKGNFYGPRADADDLETAGTWNLGIGTNNTLTIIGSFGAKKPPID